MILAMLVIATGVTYWVRAKPMQVLFSADLSKFPMQVGNWRGERDDLGAELQKTLDADDLVSFSYQSEDSYDRLGLMIAYRRYGRRGFAHRPEMCYPASGWTVISTSYVKVPYDGRDIQAKEVVAEKDDQREIIVYWFASGERTEANYVKQQYWMALDRLRTQKYGWAFVRVNCPVTITDDDARAEIRRFLQSASAPLASILTGRKSAFSKESTQPERCVARRQQ